MLSSSAAALLDGVRILHQARSDWLRLISFGVTVTSAVEGAVVTRWMVDDNELRKLLRNGGVNIPGGANGTLLLPVFTSERLQVPVAESISMTGVAGTQPLRLLRCDTVRRIAEQGGARIPPDYDRVVAASVQHQDIDQIAELTIGMAFVPGDGIYITPGGLGHTLRVLNPIGLLDVPPLRGMQPEAGIELTLPEEVRADTAVVAVSSLLEADISQKLEGLRAAVANSSRRVLRGPIVARQLRRTAPVLRDAAQALRAEENRLGRITRNRAVDASRAQRNMADGARDLEALGEDMEARADRAMARHHLASIRRRKLARMIERSHAIYTRWDHHRLVTRLQPQSDAGGVLMACPAAPIEELRIVYSTHLSDLRMRRLGTSQALLVLSAVLLLLAWRLQTAWPLVYPEHIPGDEIRTEALKSSRDSLVALLLVLPALLFTQRDHIEADRHLLDPTIGISLGLASLAFLQPVGIAVLALGDVRPNLVIDACTAAGASTAMFGVAIGLLFNEAVLSRLRAYSCRRMVSR